MRKAYSYIRMSTDSQLKGDSLRRQLKLSQNYAEENNLQIIEEIDGVSLSDIGISGYRGANRTKGALAKFLEQLELGKIEPGSVLLIESFDRLSREEIVTALSQFLRIVNYDIEIITLADGQRYTKQSLNENASLMFISLGVMFRANEESATKSKRLKAVWENKRNNAFRKPLTKIAPAWLEFSSSKDTFILREDRAEVVRHIFELCADVCGQGSIARRLNQQNVPTFGRSKLWNVSYIKKIISNRAVLGEYIPHKMTAGNRTPTGEVINNYYPAVVSEDLFLRANAALKNRKIKSSGRKGKTFSNLFHGILYCKCGARINYRNRGNPPKGGKYLVCRDANLGGTCNAPEWRYDHIESLIFQHLRELDFSAMVGKQSHSDEAESNLMILKQKYENKENAIKELFDLFIAANTTPEAKARIQERLNTDSQEAESLKEQIKSATLHLQQQKIESDVFSKGYLSEAIQLIQDKGDDYFFRSSVNQLLSKAISKIELIVDWSDYSPWEIDHNDEIVQDFRRQNPELINLSHDDLLKNRHFIQFFLQHGKRISIHYKNGETRQLLLGYEVSFPAASPKRQYKNKVSGHFISASDIVNHDPDSYYQVIVRR